MSGRYLTDLADVLRAEGLKVVELDGWKTRARSSGGYDGAPWAVFWHHTASAGNGAADADFCTFRSSDRPVCNVVVGRDGTVYVCAAGATNTNGKGGPYKLPDGRTIPLDSANSRVFGIEVSNDGVGMSWPAVQVDATFAVSIAVCRAYIDAKYTNVVQHVDWAPTRKIDPATSGAVEGGWRPRSINSSGSWALDDLRAECSKRGAGTTPGPSPDEGGTMTDDRYLIQHADGRWYVSDLAQYRTVVPEAQVGYDLVSTFGVTGWEGGPFVLGPYWASYVEALPITKGGA